MKNIFKQQSEVNNHPKRNNFDLSFQNHLTLKFGKLYPVFCKEVVPGDSFRIESAFGLKFMPMVFPVQSKMRASMHFFYVRNKNLWNRWEDWISGLKGSADGVEHPYISRASSNFCTGSLLDYFNIPTTIADNADVDVNFMFANTGYFYTNRSVYDLMPFERDVVPAGVTYIGKYPLPRRVFLGGLEGLDNISGLYGLLDYDTYRLSDNNNDWGYHFAYNSDDVVTLKGNVNFNVTGATALEDATQAEKTCMLLFKRSPEGIFKLFSSAIDDNPSIASNVFSAKFAFASLPLGEYKVSFVELFDNEASNQSILHPSVVYDSIIFNKLASSITDCPATPFSSDADVVRLSALPFRAYESIMNVFYRNSVVDPFRINGQVEYNKFITNEDGGADTSTPLDIYERNYEYDFLTSALPSPQQGIAPLVGFSALGEVSVTDENGNIVNAQYELAEDSSFTGKVSIHNPAASNSVKQYLSTAGMALAGLSINDFRNVNALQRFLETTIRKGYRYSDFIEGHFGKSPKYSVLDMPEFIGGYSRDVNVSQIIQSADMGVIDEKAGTLGSFAGIASCFGGSNHSISHYCDDFGFIIGIMCVTPTPSYSQLLPKMYLKSSPLDYYFNEFSQLGMQPISYEEVTPLSAYQYNLANPGSPKPLTDTFGYQRPNYDLVASVDEVHGQFRTTLRDFIISRYFVERPELGRDFLKIKNEDVNSIFSVQSPAEDNILGQIIFKVYAKRPIPRVVIPSLGR